MIDRDSFTARLKAEALAVGFDTAGVAPAVEPPGAGHLREWLDSGYAGQMHYLAKHESALQHPRHVLEGARSVLMLTMNYRTVQPAAAAPGEGRVSRYAWGNDYHEQIRPRLAKLVDFVQREQPGATARGVVDTAPLMERDFARLAGLGWIGKNTLLINKWSGSLFFLAALVTDLELACDPPHEADHCGTCRACLDACPTDAFVSASVLDASRCISYLTIELREAMPKSLRSQVGDWLFGCDVCQDVCPWNRRAPQSQTTDFEPSPGSNPFELAPLFSLDAAAFRHRFQNSPLWRAKRRGLLRNAAMVLGNQRHEPALAALALGLADGEPLVRSASAWALGEIGSDAAIAALRDRLAVESDQSALRAIDEALAAAATQGERRESSSREKRESSSYEKSP